MTNEPAEDAAQAAQGIGLDETQDGASSPALPFATAPGVMDGERYEVLELLGKGGMGAVYKARDRKLGRTVALKFILGNDPQLTARFLKEARAQARIEHEHVCKVYEVGEKKGVSFIAMQLISGQPLSVAQGSLSLEEKVEVMITVSDAVHAAHRQGIIHRDLKPSNIILERLESGRLRPVVMDFGLAHDSAASQALTQSGALLGTPQYMPPEQARGETRRIDRRSDVYSLGAMLYELLTKVPPFHGDSITDVLLKVLDVEPKLPRQLVPDVPLDLQTIALKCLQKDPGQRYDSARALAEDLQRYRDGEPIVGQRTRLPYRALRWASKRRAVVALGSALLISVLGAVGYGVRAQVQARRQRQLGQRLGQEMRDLEWLLRTARVMPLHDLNREKKIVRQRMQALNTELSALGEVGRPLAHYALGRGHMALHEYAQAKQQLEQAIAQGFTEAEAHYALGVVLGKHFEQALYEVRLSGRGEWAKKQRSELVPRYLTTALASLERSRSMKHDAPEYLEALLAFYRQDYDTAIVLAGRVLVQAPWLYEAATLQGDAHQERGQQARGTGRYEEAEREFAAAVHSYQEAAAIGQSDALIYEALADTWVSQGQMARDRGKPTQEAYTAAIAAGDKVLATDPTRIGGALKKAYAAQMTLHPWLVTISSLDRVQQCLADAQVVLDKEPDNPYARKVAANCHMIFADLEMNRGADPKPHWNKGLALLEPIVSRNPHFLSGQNDLGMIHAALGTYLHDCGQDSAAQQALEQSVKYFSAAIELDNAYLGAIHGLLFDLTRLLSFVRSPSDLQKLSARVEQTFDRCRSVNSKYQLCYLTTATFYMEVAELFLTGDEDPEPYLARATQRLADWRQFDASILVGEQHQAVTYLLAARDRVRRKEDPTAELVQMQAALHRCFALDAKDLRCSCFALQAQWVRADWLALQKQPYLPTLSVALKESERLAQTLEPDAELWLTQTETHLRLARAQAKTPAVSAPHLDAGLAAIGKLLATNPRHAHGCLLRGELLLLRAQTAPASDARRAAARDAIAALEQSTQHQPIFARRGAELLARARALLAAP